MWKPVAGTTDGMLTLFTGALVNACHAFFHGYQLFKQRSYLLDLAAHAHIAIEWLDALAAAQRNIGKALSYMGRLHGLLRHASMRCQHRQEDFTSTALFECESCQVRIAASSHVYRCIHTCRIAEKYAETTVSTIRLLKLFQEVKCMNEKSSLDAATTEWRITTAAVLDAACRWMQGATQEICTPAQMRPTTEAVIRSLSCRLTSSQGGSKFECSSERFCVSTLPIVLLGQQRTHAETFWSTLMITGSLCNAVTKVPVLEAAIVTPSSMTCVIMQSSCVDTNSETESMHSDESGSFQSTGSRMDVVVANALLMHAVLNEQRCGSVEISSLVVIAERCQKLCAQLEHTMSVRHAAVSVAAIAESLHAVAQDCICRNSFVLVGEAAFVAAVLALKAAVRARLHPLSFLSRCLYFDCAVRPGFICDLSLNPSNQFFLRCQLERVLVRAARNDHHCIAFAAGSKLIDASYEVDACFMARIVTTLFLTSAWHRTWKRHSCVVARWIERMSVQVTDADSTSDFTDDGRERIPLWMYGPRTLVTVALVATAMDHDVLAVQCLEKLELSTELWPSLIAAAATLEAHFANIGKDGLRLRAAALTERWLTAEQQAPFQPSDGQPIECFLDTLFDWHTRTGKALNCVMIMTLRTGLDAAILIQRILDQVACVRPNQFAALSRLVAFASAEAAGRLRISYRQWQTAFLHTLINNDCRARLLLMSAHLSLNHGQVVTAAKVAQAARGFARDTRLRGRCSALTMLCAVSSNNWLAYEVSVALFDEDMDNAPWWNLPGLVLSRLLAEGDALRKQKSATAAAYVFGHVHAVRSEGSSSEVGYLLGQAALFKGSDHMSVRCFRSLVSEPTRAISDLFVETTMSRYRIGHLAFACSRRREALFHLACTIDSSRCGGLHSLAQLATLSLAVAAGGVGVSEVAISVLLHASFAKAMTLFTGVCSCDGSADLVQFTADCILASDFDTLDIMEAAMRRCFAREVLQRNWNESWTALCACCSPTGHVIVCRSTCATHRVTFKQVPSIWCRELNTAADTLLNHDVSATIRMGSDYSKNRSSDRRRWWSERHHLELKLDALMRNLYLCLGATRVLLAPMRMAQDTPARSEQVPCALAVDCSHTLMRAQRSCCSSLTVGVVGGDMDAASILDVMKDMEARSAYTVDTATVDAGALTGLQVHATPAPAVAVGAGVDSRMSIIGPIILILDKTLRRLPVEVVPTLAAVVATRVPGLVFALDIATQNALRTSASRHTMQHGLTERRACPRIGRYVVDPNNDLIGTQEILAHGLGDHLWHWTGVMGTHPTSEFLCEALSRADVLLYSGHGDGRRFFRGCINDFCSRPPLANSHQGVCDEGRGDASSRATTLLMGCASGRLADDEPCVSLELGGTVGCANVIATLWDVTDRDIDRFTLAILNQWAARPRNCAADLVSHARGACKLPLLNGAAVVCYGVPVS
eukprot:CAMPEP_0185694102 /NCGR_PEP_ID=MMETSP1164-20130828/3683_1 /TAXON_ID=1104430 /ORGANISM="Chrysoreinhardia sp, Strain CCMP2950" /LENGTH=1449 /DNA_ID=CAMNT_0028360929 /DNA_START=636 /DNA_END=4985 /DNA_ORIENTATION=+